MPNPYLQVVSTNAFIDATGAAMAAGTLLIQPVDASNNAIPFRSGDNRQVSSKPIQCTITNGTIDGTLQLANPTHPEASPQDVGYTFIVTDTATGCRTIYPSVLIQDAGDGTWNIGTLATGQYIRAIPVTLVQGAPGPAGQNGVASLPQLARREYQGTGSPNIYRANRLVAGGFVAQDGSVASNPSFSYYRCRANSGGTMICSRPLGFGNSYLAFYGNDGSYIANSSMQVAAGVAFNVPAAAAELAFTPADSSPLMLCYGSTLPATYQDPDPDPVTASDMNIALAAVRATGTTSALPFLPLRINFFDKNRITTDTILLAGNGATEGFNGHFVSVHIPVTPGVTYKHTITDSEGNNAFANHAWYDAQGNFISAQPLNGTSTPIVEQAPSNAASIVLQGLTASAGTQMLEVAATSNGQYLPFMPSADNLLSSDTANSATLSPLRGKRVAFFGDSITQLYGNTWQPTVLARTGLVNAFQDARAGRSFRETFEAYGNSPTGTRTDTYNDGQNTNPSNNINTGTTGNTLAQDLAAANVDIAIVFLGTNDNGYATSQQGSPGDSFTWNSSPQGGGSEYGRARWVIQGIQAARPGMAVLVVEQYQNTFAASFATLTLMRQCVEYAALTIGAPTLDLSTTCGISFVSEAGGAGHYLYTVDGTHPSTAGGLRIGACIAGELLRRF